MYQGSSQAVHSSSASVVQPAASRQSQPRAVRHRAPAQSSAKSAAKHPCHQPGTPFRPTVRARLGWDRVDRHQPLLAAQRPQGPEGLRVEPEQPQRRDRREREKRPEGQANSVAPVAWREDQEGQGQARGELDPGGRRQRPCGPAQARDGVVRAALAGRGELPTGRAQRERRREQQDDQRVVAGAPTAKASRIGLRPRKAAAACGQRAPLPPASPPPSRRRMPPTRPCRGWRRRRVVSAPAPRRPPQAQPARSWQA